LVFKNAKAARALKYISPDIDSHSGGVWKAASSIEKLFSETTRTGTFDKFLRWIAP